MCTSISLVESKTLDLVFKRKWLIHWHHIAVMLLTKYVCRRGVEHTNLNTSVEFCRVLQLMRKDMHLLNCLVGLCVAYGSFALVGL
jgi:hypothetical protein